MKQEKGIAKLGISSIVISVMIIAGVSVSLQVGEDGLLNKTIFAVNEYNMSSAKEKVDLLVTSFLMDYYDDKYLQGENVEPVIGTYISTKLDEYIASKDKIENYNLTKLGKIVTLENGNNIAKGEINDDGTINWDSENLPSF